MTYDIKKASESLLAVLPKRSATVLEKRYGLGKSTKQFTLEAIGTLYSITRERVRQIESDALNRIRKSSVYAGTQPLFSSFKAYITERGGMVEEGHVLARFAGGGVSAPTVRFLLTLTPQAIFRGESDIFQSRWGVDGNVMDVIEHALNRVAGMLLTRPETISYEELVSLLQKEFIQEGVPVPTNEVMAGYITTSKQIGNNYFGEWGHTFSALIHPRGIRDLAYLVFQKTGEPMHFLKAAERIREIAVSRRVHAQTVHNELIKDSRFVLVGRGTYALVEWGYEPGTVHDIITRVLASRPLCKEDLIKEILAKRRVKENTILINLQNKKFFRRFPDGTYGTVV